MGPVIHKDEVGMVAVQTGQVPLAVLIHDVLSWEAALGMERRARTDGKLYILPTKNRSSIRLDK